MTHHEDRRWKVKAMPPVDAKAVGGRCPVPEYRSTHLSAILDMASAAVSIGCTSTALVMPSMKKNRQTMVPRRFIACNTATVSGRADRSAPKQRQVSTRAERCPVHACRRLSCFSWIHIIQITSPILQRSPRSRKSGWSYRA